MNLLLINREKRDIWQIPENNYIDVTYLIREERVNEIMANNIGDINDKNLTNEKYNITKNKNLVLYKKINNNINKNNNNIDIICNNNNNNNISSSNNINKANTSYSLKIRNIFNLKFNNNSNDTSIGTEIKKLKIEQKNSFFKAGIKKISYDYKEGNSTIFNKKEANKKRSQTIYSKKATNRGKNFDKENDEQSYAFQNLINLNKKNDIFNTNNNINDGNKSYNIQIKPSLPKKRLGKSPDCAKFYKNESKNFFNEEKYKKKSKNDAENKIIDSLIDNKIQNANRKTIAFNKSNNWHINELNEERENNLYHKTIKCNNDKNISEYDGDMETITYRHISFSKGNNQKNSGVNNALNIKNDINENENIEIIEPKNIKLQNINYNTFCSGFFVSGIPIPIKDNSLVEDSNNFLAPCGHKFCSLLFSIRPEILYFYKNEKLDISNDMLAQISSLAFPLGAKLCIDTSFEPKKLIQIPQQIFYNIIENSKNEKLYLCTKYYFIRIKNEELKSNFGFDVSSFFSEKTSKINDKNFKNYISTASRILNGNPFYIPQSITLVSKEPFLNPMSIILNSFVTSLSEDRVDLINHIINEVPIPEESETQLKFYIPIYTTPVVLNNEINMYKVMSLLNKEKQKDIYDNNLISKEQLNYRKLFEIICTDHIIFIFSMLLLEQNFLFIYNNYEALSQIIFIFLSLLYPFSWGNKHIFPVLSLDTLNLLNLDYDSSINDNKFIAGMDECLFNYIDKTNNNIFDNCNNLIIYNLSQRCFIYGKNKKKTTRSNILHDYKLFTFPNKINNFLGKELKGIINYIKTNQEKMNINNKSIENDQNFYKNLIFFRQNLEIMTKSAFLKSMIMLIGDYNNYTFYIDEEKPLFNKEDFIESHKDKDFKNYLNMFLNTNLFNDFLNDQKKLFINDKNSTIQSNTNNRELNNIKYFIKFILQNQGLLNNHQIKKNTSINIITPDIYSKAKNICSKLALINNNNSNININKDNLNNENSFVQINKKKTNIFFSGKNYLEDKPQDNINYTNSKSKNKSKKFPDTHIDDYKPFNSNPHIMLKESKASTESSTINALFHSLNKSDLKISCDNQKNKIVYININSNRKISGYEKLGEKKEILKKYLLVPYFLNLKGDDDDYIKEKNSIEIIINEINMYKKRKNIKDKIPPFIILITTFSKKIDYETFNINKNKVYLINNNQICNNAKSIDSKAIKWKDTDNDNNISKEAKKFKKKYFKEEISDKDIINLNNIYGNDEEVLLINTCFKSCFLNKSEFSNQHFNLLKKLFLNLENMEHFANLIYPEFFRKNKAKNSLYHKQLTINSYNIFSKMIKLSFENLKINDNIIGRLLTMACFIYYKIEKEKVVYLYTNFLINKQDNQKNMQPYILWRSESFWIEFFNWEFENNTKEKEEDEEYEINQDKINEENDDDWEKKMCLIKTVIGISNIMSKLNLDKNFIINIIEKMILPVFINDFYYINLIMNFALSTNNVT